MSKRILSAFCALSLLAAPVAWAAPAKGDPISEEKKPIQVVQGIFEDESGQTVRFQVADGGAVRIKNERQGLYYRLSARILDKERAEFRLQHFLDPDLTLPAGDETFVGQAGDLLTSAIAPFKLTPTGIKTALATKAKSPISDQPNYTWCCIWCGDWVICCEIWVYSGWLCCTIDTACFTCTICEIAEQ